MYLEAFNNARNNFMLETRVLTLSILSNHNNIHILMPRRKPRKVETVDQRSIQIQLFPQLNIERADSTAHRCPKPTFQTHFVFLNRLDHLLRDLAQVPVYIVLLEEHRRVHGLHDLFDRVCHEWAHPVTRDQGHGAWGAVARSWHVGDGAREGEARGGGELVEERDDVSTSHVGFFGVLCVPLGVRLG